MDLVALSDFNLVASHGGFGRASRASGRPKATLSRRVAELEGNLGVRLVERGSRSMRLTEAGAGLHDRTRHLLGELAEAGEAVTAGLDRPRGHLRVSAPVLVAHTILGRVAADFIRVYPEVLLDIVAEDRFVDPAEEGYDIVLRIDPQPSDRLIGRCLLRDEQWLVGSPTLDLPPASRDVGCPIVARVLIPSGTIWAIRDEDRTFEIRPEPVLVLSSLLMVREAVLAGAGAGLLPRSMVAEDVAAGRLVRWGKADGMVKELWAMHTSRRLVSAKVRAFLATLEASVPGDRFRD